MSLNTKGSGFDVQTVETERGCEGSECLGIIKKIKGFYDDTFRKIDDELGSDGAEVKLKAMQSYISDLEEQHAVFLQTMVQLEQEAGDRVLLLQEGLHRSSQAAFAYRTKLDDYDKNDFLEKSEGAVKTYPDDEILRLHLALERCKEDREREVSELEAKIAMLKFEVEQNDVQIQRFIRRIEAFHNNMCNKLNECSTEYQSGCGNVVNETSPDECLRCSLEDFHECFQRALEEKEELIAEIKCLKTELKESKAETEELSKTVNGMKQSNKDIRESLAAEVAEKHDEIIALRRMIQHLTETCREAEIMVRFKDDIIKQMRKDRKASEFKHVSRSPDCKSEVNNSQPDEQSLCIVSQRIDNDPNDNQQVQSCVNKSDYWLEQIHTSPDEPQHSFPRKFHSTPKKSDVTDQLSVGETRYMVCQRNYPLARDGQLSADENDMSGHKIDTAHLENLASEV